MGEQPPDLDERDHLPDHQETDEGKRSDLALGLSSSGISGLAHIAVMSALAPCSPKPCCLQGVGTELEKWTMQLMHQLEEDGNTLHNRSVAAMSAFLAILDNFGELSFEGLWNHASGSELSGMCGINCFRLLPNDDALRKGLRQRRDELIQASEGNALFVIAQPRGSEMTLQLALAGAQSHPTSQAWEHLNKVCLAPKSLSRVDAQVGRNVLKFARLVMVREYAHQHLPNSGRRARKLEVPGLRVHGDLASWSAFYNQLASALQYTET